jgi:enoyl-CoA hydratase/carnithine racemase
MGVFCRRWGVPLVDGGTVRLARLIGLSNALVYYTFLFIVIVIALFLFVNLKDSRSI